MPEQNPNRSTPKGNRVTMSQVADFAGVSSKTVSRVINGEPSVSDAAKSSVLNAIEALDYHLDMRASSLRRSDNRTRTIGLLVSSVDNPFSGQLQRGVEEAAQQRGCVVITSSLGENPKNESRLINDFIARHVDGILLETAESNAASINSEMIHGTPIVFVDREPPQGVEADCVASDNFEASYRATSHLIRQGHREIAILLGQERLLTMSERLRGYRAALEAASIPVNTDLISHGIIEESDACTAVERILSSDHKPSAIFSCQNTITIGAVRALHHNDKQETIAFVGFDDIPLSDVLSPNLTVIEQFPRLMGKMAGELLFRRILSPNMKYQKIEIPTKIHHRRSGDITPSATSMS